MEQQPLQSAEEWAVHTFGAAELGDPRRTDRLMRVASGLAATPSASLPQALCPWGETQRAYRLLNLCQVPEKLNIKARVNKEQKGVRDQEQTDQENKGLTLRVASSDYKR